MTTLHDQIDFRHDDFLARLATIQKHARHVFRNRPEHDRQDAVDEAVAAAWKMWAAMVRRGLDPTVASATGLADWAVRHVRAGRKVGYVGEGGRGHRDLFDWRAGHEIVRLEDVDSDWADWLIADRRAGIPDTVATKIDFETWLATRSPRDKAVFHMLALGSTTTEVAAYFGVSMGRVSQLRAEAKHAWEAFSEA